MSMGATQAPASVLRAPMAKATPRLPFSFLRMPNWAWKREKSIWMRSNMASPSTTKRAAMPALNQTVELMEPKALESPRTTARPSPP